MTTSQTRSGRNELRRETCGTCNDENVVGFSVPDDVWARVTGGRTDVLCLSCFDQLATAKSISWADQVSGLWLVDGCWTAMPFFPATRNIVEILRRWLDYDDGKLNGTEAVRLDSETRAVVFGNRRPTQ